MDAVSTVGPGAGEIVGDSPDRRVEILADADPLHATWSRFGPGREGAGLHVHHHHTDLFYVLDGELTVRMGIEDRHVAVGAGNLVRVPPLVVHGFRNGGAADVRYLNFHAPGCGFAGFMRGLRDGTGVGFDQDEPPADGGRPVTDAVIGEGDRVADEAGRRIDRLCDEPEIAISRIELGAGSAPEPIAAEAYLYVLEGDAAVAADDGRAELIAGSWAAVPDGAAISPAGPEAVRYLAIHAPGAT